MTTGEKVDLEGIVQAGFDANARDDVLRLLKEISWVTPAEKLQFWEELPGHLRAWLSPATRRAA